MYMYAWIVPLHIETILHKHSEPAKDKSIFEQVTVPEPFVSPDWFLHL